MHLCVPVVVRVSHGRSYSYLNGTRGSDTYAGWMPRKREGPETASESVPATGFTPDVAPPVTR